MNCFFLCSLLATNFNFDPMMKSCKKLQLIHIIWESGPAGSLLCKLHSTREQTALSHKHSIPALLFLSEQACVKSDRIYRVYIYIVYIRRRAEEEGDLILWFSFSFCQHLAMQYRPHSYGVDAWWFVCIFTTVDTYISVKYLSSRKYLKK
jgi:hypothetical protein